MNLSNDIGTQNIGHDNSFINGAQLIETLFCTPSVWKLNMYFIYYSFQRKNK